MAKKDKDIIMPPGGGYVGPPKPDKGTKGK